MKTHAFVRENFPKVLAYKEEGIYIPLLMVLYNILKILIVV